MITQKILSKKLPFIILVTVLAGIHILWEHYNGGVVTHHILASDDMPGISNWWELISIPLVTFILLTLIHKEYQKNPSKQKLLSITKGFIAGLCFGALISILWEFRFEHILQYLILFPVAVSLIKPVYLPQYVLGFILSMTFTFGGILPIGFAVILSAMSFIVWMIFSKAIPFLYQKIS